MKLTALTLAAAFAATGANAGPLKCFGFLDKQETQILTMTYFGETAEYKLLNAPSGESGTMALNCPTAYKSNACVVVDEGKGVIFVVSNPFEGGKALTEPFIASVSVAALSPEMAKIAVSEMACTWQ